jgi:hypothetical protein
LSVDLAAAGPAALVVAAGILAEAILHCKVSKSRVIPGFRLLKKNPLLAVAVK